MHTHLSHTQYNEDIELRKQVMVRFERLISRLFWDSFRFPSARDGTHTNTHTHTRTHTIAFCITYATQNKPVYIHAELISLKEEHSLLNSTLAQGLS